MTEEDVFTSALSRPPADRGAFLDSACAADAALRRRVEALLAAHDRAGNFLDPPTTPLRPRGELPTPFGHGRAETDPPELLADRYRIVRPLGEGGMGVVYLAEQIAPVRRDVAVKIIRPGMGSAAVVGRFEAERQALAVMDHPNIAKVLDGGTTPDGRPFFVMELVNGVPVTRFCDVGRLALRDRLHLFLAVCSAVQHAHQKGVIHRDIKPSNVLVAESDDGPVPKVIDFGVAKAVGGRLADVTAHTEYGMLIGTPEYMAPELADLSAHDADTRADVYALAVVLYELLTGTTPFDTARLRQGPLLEALRIIREEEPPPPSLRLRQMRNAEFGMRNKAPSRGFVRIPHSEFRIPHWKELDWVVMRGLEKDRTRRYESVAALAEDVRRFLADEPVSAGPPSGWYRARKFVRRNRGPVLAAAVAAVGLVAGTVAATVGMIRARDAEGLAGERRDEAVAAGKRAQEAEARAVEERDVAQAVSDFLGRDLLPFADIDYQIVSKIDPDPDIKLRALLDRAAAQIEGKFADQPRIEARLRLVIGRTYTRLAEYRLAERHLERAAELAARLYRPDTPEDLEVRYARAIHFNNSEQYDRAAGLFAGLAESYRRVEEPDAAKVLTIRYALLKLDTRVRSNPPNEREAEALLADCTRALGHNHDLTWRVRLLLGLIHVKRSRIESTAGRQDSAREHLATGSGHIIAARGELGRIAGPDHPQTLFAQSLHGQALTLGREFEAAEAVLVATLTRQRAALGPDRYDTVMTTQLLGELYYVWQKPEKAEPLLVGALDWHRKRGRAEAVRTTQLLNNLAAVYQRLKKYDQAAAALDEAIRFYRDLPHADPRTLLTFQCNAAMNDYIQQQYPRAEPGLRQVRDGLREAGLAETDLYRQVLAALGFSLYQQKKYDEAEPVLREAVGVARKLQPDDWRTFETVSHHGATLTALRKFEEAEPLLVEGYEGIDRRKAAIPPQDRHRLRDAAIRTARLYQAWGKTDLMNAWVAKFAPRPPLPTAPPPRPVDR